MKLSALLATFVVLSGCTSKVACDYKPQIVSSATGAITKQLECTNTGAIAKDVEAMVEKAGICPKTEITAKGTIPASVCDAVGGAMAGAIANQIPATWGCSATGAKEGLAKAISDACQSQGT